MWLATFHFLPWEHRPLLEFVAVGYRAGLVVAGFPYRLEVALRKDFLNDFHLHSTVDLSRLFEDFPMRELFLVGFSPLLQAIL